MRIANVLWDRQSNISLFHSVSMIISETSDEIRASEFQSSILKSTRWWVSV